MSHALAKGDLMRLHQLALVAALTMSVPAALAAQTTDQNGGTKHGRR